MTKYIKCGGGGLPPQVLSDMEAVLNKKFGTSTTYPSNTWPDLIRTMIPLPEKTASGSIAHFSDGADTVPLKSSKFYITPTQASGTPTPSNPLPITGWTGANVVHTGANVWDEETEKGRISTTTGENVADNNYLRTVNYIPVKGGQSYKLYISGSTTKWAAVLTYDANKTFLANLGGKTGNSVITLNSDVAYIRFYLSDSYGTTYNNDVAFLYPSTLTDYAPYTATTYPVSWSEQGTVYGGYFKDGELWKSWGMKKASDLTFTHYEVSQGHLFRSQVVSDCINEVNLTRMICSDYKTVYPTSRTDNTISCTLARQFDIIDNRFTTVEDFLENVDCTIVYPLATPVKVADLEEVEINSLLGVNNIWCDTGDCEVEYRADIELSLNE